MPELTLVEKKDFAAQYAALAKHISSNGWISKKDPLLQRVVQYMGRIIEDKIDIPNLPERLSKLLRLGTTRFDKFAFNLAAINTNGLPDFRAISVLKFTSHTETDRSIFSRRY
jgi:hypothetical protein